MIISLLSAGFFGCDVIDGPYFEMQDSGEEIVENPQKVLIMDYTGHTCKSCPKAHRTVHMIKQVYGDNAVPVVFHLGYFSRPRDDGKYFTDFRTPEGDELEGYYDFVSFPTGWVNRMGKEDLIPYPSWAAETSRFLQKQSPVIIEIIAKNESADNQVAALINIKKNGELPSGLKMAVYLTESHVLAYQKDEDATPMDVENYEHNHIFRDAYGSVWGETIDFNDCGGSGLDFVRKIKVDPEWVPENCSFVVFVYDSSTMEVLQVEGAEIGE